MLRRKQLIVVVLIAFTAGAMLLLMASTMNSKKSSGKFYQGSSSSRKQYSGSSRQQTFQEATQDEDEAFETDMPLGLSSPTDAAIPSEPSTATIPTSYQPSEVATVVGPTMEKEVLVSEGTPPSKVATVGNEVEEGNDTGGEDNEVEEDDEAAGEGNEVGEGNEAVSEGDDDKSEEVEIDGAENEVETDGAENEAGGDEQKSELDENGTEASEPNTPDATNNDATLEDQYTSKEGSLKTSFNKETLEPITSSPVVVTTQDKSHDFTEVA